MKLTLPKLILAAATLFLGSCASTATPGASSSSVSGVKPYPLKLCIVTDNDLGSMGDEQGLVYQGREIKFCCAPCVDKFRNNPAKYLAKLH